MATGTSAKLAKVYRVGMSGHSNPLFLLPQTLLYSTYEQLDAMAIASYDIGEIVRPFKSCCIPFLRSPNAEMLLERKKNLSPVRRGRLLNTATLIMA
jgi:hypothetical protein